MNIRTTIKAVKCPSCQKYLILKRAIDNGQPENTWSCSNCHSFYPEYWFDVFKQFEEFVER